MSLYNWVNRPSTDPLATTVAFTDAAVYPLLVAAIVAGEVTAAALVAETVTVCAVFQFDGVKVSEAGAAETVVAPALRATATVTFAVGAADSATLKVLLSPGDTVTDDASATIAGVVLAS